MKQQYRKVAHHNGCEIFVKGDFTKVPQKEKDRLNKTTQLIIDIFGEKNAVSN